MTHPLLLLGQGSSTGAATVTLADPGGGDGPVAFDDQLNGLYLEKTNGNTTEITDSDASSDTVTVADSANISVDDLVQIRRNSAGDELLYLEHPTHKSTYGLRVKPLDRPDLPDVANLVSDVASAFADVDSDADGLADGWNKVGTPTVTQETGAEFHRHGTAAMKVVASAGEGLITDAISVSPTDVSPFFTAQALVRAASGSVQLQIIDASNNDTPYPDMSVQAALSSTLDTLEPLLNNAGGANFADLSTTSLKVQIVARGGSSTFYLDAAQLTQRGGPTESFFDGRGANRLWQAANNELSDVAAPEDQYDVESVDLYRTDTSTYPDDQIALGNTLLVKDPDLSFDVEVRAVGVRRELTEPGDVRLSIDNRRKRLADRLSRRDPRRLFDESPPQSGSDTTAGNPLSALAARFGSFQPFADTGRWAIPGVITDNTSNLKVDVSQGELFVVQFSPQATFTAQGMEAVHVNGSSNATQRGKIRLCVYSDSENFPHTLLFESADFDVDSDTDNAATDVEVSGTIVEFEVGEKYWVGFQCTNSPDDPDLPDMVFWTGGLAVPHGGTSASGGLGVGLKATGQGSACPTVFPDTASVHGRVPQIGLLV